MESVNYIFSSALLVNYLSRLHRVLVQCWRARQRDVFYKMFMFSLFKVTKSNQKAMSKVRTIDCCSK